jgi:hypothetical protein
VDDEKGEPDESCDKTKAGKQAIKNQEKHKNPNTPTKMKPDQSL